MTRVTHATRRLLAVLAVGTLAATLAAGATAAAPAHHGTAHRTPTKAAASRHHTRANVTHGFMTVTSIPWGSVGGQPVQLYTLSNGGGIKATITNYGGTVQSIWVPDKSGKLTNVALGFPTLNDYVSDFTQGAAGAPWPVSGGSGNVFFGATIGRYANRIANATFPLNGTSYTLDANNGVNSLHGGYLGWNTVVWTPAASTGPGTASLTLTHAFPAGEGCLPSLSPGCTGYPAAVLATVKFTVTSDNQLQVSYAITNESSTLATVVNVTNHSYFNLAGEASGDMYGQLLALNADSYTPVNNNLIPEPPYFVPVSGTAYDFRSMHPIGQLIRSAGLPDGTSGPLTQLQIAHGYDNNWVLSGYPSYRLAAVAQDVQNGVTMWTYTDQPGVQLYTSNFMVGDLIGTSGSTYRQGAGFTLETQHYPDSPNHIGDAGWPSVVLNAGGTFTSLTSFKFGIEGPLYQYTVRFP